MNLSSCPVTRKKTGGEREGRGFSRGELKKAGVSRGQALGAGLPIDLRRRTVYEENVQRVTQRLERIGASKAVRAKPKKP